MQIAADFVELLFLIFLQRPGLLRRFTFAQLLLKVDDLLAHGAHAVVDRLGRAEVDELRRRFSGRQNEDAVMIAVPAKRFVIDDGNADEFDQGGVGGRAVACTAAAVKRGVAVGQVGILLREGAVEFHLHLLRFGTPLGQLLLELLRLHARGGRQGGVGLQLLERAITGDALRQRIVRSDQMLGLAITAQRVERGPLETQRPIIGERGRAGLIAVERRDRSWWGVRP